jgi:Zn-dependent M28 family amino/carboxypeptidase
MIGRWGGEENGLIGSRRFVSMHPEVLEGLQALFNQDNGTGRISNIGLSGFTQVGDTFRGWLSRVPAEISGQINVSDPGRPGSGGTDHASFVCAKVPAFNLSSNSWGYSTVTWHTNLDTFDKVVPEEIRWNATLTAMLVYMASENPQKLSRATADQGALPWPECRDGARQSSRASGG